MPDTAIYDAERELTLIVSTGVATINDWNYSRSRILEYYEKFDSNQVLVDVREQEIAPGTLDVLGFGANWPRAIKLAIVIGTATEDTHHFLETVAVYRGRPIKLFKSVKSALKWLGKEFCPAF